jgi:hypothetical protein
MREEGEQEEHKLLHNLAGRLLSSSFLFFFHFIAAGGGICFAHAGK